MAADSLSERPFSYLETKSGLVTISRDGRVAKTLRGAEASRFLSRVERLPDDDAQRLMAKVTGQFKFGNER